jgi:hypothetical protein
VHHLILLIQLLFPFWCTWSVLLFEKTLGTATHIKYLKILHLKQSFAAFNCRWLTAT